MRILVTGGAGFVGCNLADRALAEGHEVLVFDNLSRLGCERNLTWLQRRSDFRFVHGDMRSEQDVASVVARFKPDAVLHLAGQVAMTTSIEFPISDFATNAMGTLFLLESMRRFVPDGRIIYASTNKVYGDLETIEVVEDKTRYICPDYPRGFAEDVPLEFHSPYGCSKGAADQYVLDYHRMFGIRAIVFRHSSMYGGRQFSTFDQGWVGWFCQQASLARQGKGAPFSISGNGKQVRDLLHVDDAVDLYLGAARAPESALGHAYNIGGGIDNSLSIVELLNHLESRLDVRLEHYRIPARASDQKVFVADTGKAQQMLLWRPKVAVSEGIDELLAWTAEIEGSA